LPFGAQRRGESMPFEYSAIETQIIEALPELRPAAERYWDDEGPPGEDSGPYIFFSTVVTTYVDVLLAMPEGGGRDRLLARAYGLVEAMLDHQPDKDVRDLAYIEALEWQSPWWYARSSRFLGPNAIAELDRWEPTWRTASPAHADADPEREIIDIYGVRDIVFAKLASEVLDLAQIPGISTPRKWQLLPGIETARAIPDAVAFVSCFGTSVPYVLCPIAEVACEEASLERLAMDLADIEHTEPNQRTKAQAAFYRIAHGERVWGMAGVAGDKHSRWKGSLWIADQFSAKGLEKSIRDVLAGRSARLKP
jgi:hypothetical protein